MKNKIIYHTKKILQLIRDMVLDRTV